VIVWLIPRCPLCSDNPWTFPFNGAPTPGDFAVCVRCAELWTLAVGGARTPTAGEAFGFYMRGGERFHDWVAAQIVRPDGTCWGK
jgi:hypothetical protein